MAWLRAIVPLIEGDLDAATRCLESEGSSPTIATAAFPLRCMAAEIALAHGGWRRAAALLDEIEPGIATTFFHHYAATVHLLRAHVARAAAQPREAETRTHRALELAAEHELQLVATDALETLAVLAADVDEIANAGRLLGAADGFRERTGYRWIHPHRRADLDAIRERIDPAHRAERAALSLAEAIAWARRGRGERRPTVSTVA